MILREYTALEIEEYDDARLELAEDGKIDYTRVYIKSEADTHIGELTDKINSLQYDNACLRNELSTYMSRHKNYLEVELESRLRHQKYKRCRAMAKYCYDFWVVTKGSEKEWCHRWCLKWRELADKFKNM